MRLTICGPSALYLLRELRSKGRPLPSDRYSFGAPSPDGKRWSRASISLALQRAGSHLEPREDNPVHVLVPLPSQRLQVAGISSTTCMVTLPDKPLLSLSREVSMSSPELLFVEMGARMDDTSHLLLGMELTGRFTRDAADPDAGPATYDIEPATTVSRLRAFIAGTPNLKGVKRARKTVDRIVENAWSPREALVAALLNLPMFDLGYDLGPLDLNEIHEVDESMSATRERRIPDLLVRGTNVGLNYDGSDHMGLQAIADAGMRLGMDPGASSSQRELDEALAEARRRIVSDKRRDRDLMARGLHVLSVTNEDLEEDGGLDRVVAQLAEVIEHECGRDMSIQRAILAERDLAKARQDLIWSLMPGERGNLARKRIAARQEERKTAGESVVTGTVIMR